MQPVANSSTENEWVVLVVCVGGGVEGEGGECVTERE